jgi:DNA-binding PadR family transcriptional regulator
MSPDRLPAITHLQFLVLGLLLGRPQAGRDIRAELRRHAVRRTAPAFYQMMARLEDAGLVEGWYDQKVIDGQLIKERHYRLRPAGARAWAVTRDFYLSRLRAAGAVEEPVNG